jgi:hypothetical protein
VVVWSNMRALDYLQSRSDVDGDRIGVCGCSGGGLQTQMLVALDERVKAAVIAGLTCAFREILFPHRSHCSCNHFPGILRLADAPEISALGLPSAVLYLTMNDWTGHFRERSFPAIRLLYEANGAGERADCIYEDTDHEYGRSKREATYRWMERWLRNRSDPEAVREPEEVRTFPPDALGKLALESPRENEFSRISAHYRARWQYHPPDLSTAEEWRAYRDRTAGALAELAGEKARLPGAIDRPERFWRRQEGDLVLERIDYPGEGAVRVPAIVVRRKDAAENATKLPAVIFCADEGKDALLGREGDDAPLSWARRGFLVVLADVRFTGELSPAALGSAVGPALIKYRAASPLPAAGAGARAASLQAAAWERNSIVWGRPLTGMAATDIRSVLDGAAARSDVDPSDLRLHAAGKVAAAALLAAALDGRVREVCADLEGHSFATGTLPPFPFVLRHGDLLQWAALLADRKLTLRGIPTEAGDVKWLAGAFAAVGNEAGLRIR